MDECDELFAELEAATKEKDDYIKRLEAENKDLKRRLRIACDAYSASIEGRKKFTPAEKVALKYYAQGFASPTKH
jgi:hypothetical protein